MSDSKTVAVLEFGTSKIKVLIAEIVDNEKINIISQSMVDSGLSIKKGDIVNVIKTYEKTHEAIRNAENKASVKLDQISMALSGTHIKVFKYLTSVKTSAANGVVRASDVETAKKQIREKELDEGRSYIQQVRSAYYLDANLCANPVGKIGKVTDVEYLMIHGENDRILEILNVIHSTGIELEDMVISGIASARAVTSAQQKADGVLVVDIGAGTTDYAIIKNNTYIHAGIIPLGGNHITNDLALGLHLTPKTAESVKITSGKLFLNEEERSKIYWAIGDKQIGDKKILADSVNKIVFSRMVEMLEILREETSEYLSKIKEVVITGGVSNTIGICELAKEILGLPCSKGCFSEDLPKNVRKQSWATLLGMLEHVKSQKQKNKAKNRKRRFLLF